MIFKLCTLLQVAIWLISLCQSSNRQNHIKFEVGDEIEVIDKFISYGLYMKFKSGMKMIVTGICTSHTNLDVYSKDLSIDASKQIGISKTHFDKIRKVGQKFKVGQQIQAIEAFESSSKDRLWIKRGEIMTVKECHKNGNLIVSKEDWKAEEWIEPIDYDKIEMYRQPFETGQQIEAIAYFQTSSAPPKIIKSGEIMTIKHIDDQGDIAVYNKQWGNKYQEWIEKGDFDKIQLSPDKAPPQPKFETSKQKGENGDQPKELAYFPDYLCSNYLSSIDSSGEEDLPIYEQGKITSRQSRYKNVYWNKNAKRWIGQFTHKGEHINTKYGKNDKEVAKLVNLKCKELEIEFKNPSLRNVNLENKKFAWSANEVKPPQKTVCKNNTLNVNEDLPKSRFKNVYWNKNCNAWFGQISHKGEHINIYCAMRDNDGEEAAKLVNLKCKELGIDLKNPSLETETDNENFFISYHNADFVKIEEEDNENVEVKAPDTIDEITKNFMEDLENSYNKRKRANKNEDVQHKKQYREDQQANRKMKNLDVEQTDHLKK